MITKFIEWILLTISHRLGHCDQPGAPPTVGPAIPDGAITLGKYIDKNDGDIFYVPPELEARHILFAAGSGGGKTTAIQTLIGQLIGPSDGEGVEHETGSE